MNLSETPEESMLRDQAREFLGARYPLERVCSLADGDGFERSLWPEVAALGWTGISAPEEAGGAGLGFVEECALGEELGRALFPGPFFATVVLALPALAGAPDLVKEVVAGETVATLAWMGPSGEPDPIRFPVGAGPAADRSRLYGSAWFVPDLAIADLAVVAAKGSAGPGLWAVRLDQDPVSRRDLQTVDTTRRLGALFLEGAEGRPLAEGEDAARLLERLRDRALAFLAAEAVGLASRALEMAVEHARTREQFGRPIGAFQAVSQSLAEAYAEIECARSSVRWAAASVATEAAEAARAAAAAKALASEAAVRTCERAIQVHGGIGFTWEHPLHRFYKRAEWIQAYLGWPAELRARIAASILDDPGGPNERV
jgi:alkylation response protein AidB-like acyl-CoA dehydrogenase